MKIGYARVSTQDQHLDRQIDALKAQGCERIYQEKMTGTKAERPEFQKMLDALRPGDTLVTDSFSRLSRSTKDLLELVERLNGQGVNLISIKEQLDTTTATGKMMLTMLSALSQFERDLIAERTADGLKAARARGRMGGRPKVGSEKAKAKAIELYLTNTMSNTEIVNFIRAQYFGNDVKKFSSSTLSRWIREYKEQQNEK